MVKKATSIFLVVFLVFSLFSVIPNMSKVYASEEKSLEELIDEWKNENGLYPGADFYETGLKVYFVMGPFGENYTTPVNAEQIPTYNTYTIKNYFQIYSHAADPEGEPDDTSDARVPAGIKIQSADKDKNAFWQYVSFVTIDEALKWAESGDTIILYEDYNDYNLNGIASMKSSLLKEGPAFFEYKVSSNFTIPRGKNITIDLNGHAISGTTLTGRDGKFEQMADEDVGVKDPEPPIIDGKVTERTGITVAAGASLNIVDIAGGGKIVGAARAVNAEGEETQQYNAIENNGKLTIADNVALENPAEETGAEGTSYGLYMGKGAVTKLGANAVPSTNAKVISNATGNVFVDEETLNAYQKAASELDALEQQLQADLTEEGKARLQQLIEEKKASLADALLGNGEIGDIIEESLGEIKQDLQEEVESLPQKEDPPYIPPTPSVQKPTIEADEHATVTLSAYGTIATIKVAEGYEIADVTVNGVSKGKVDMVYGLKTGDVLKVTTVAKGETEAEKNARLKAGVENTTIKLKSTLGKGYVKLNWTKSKGYKVDKYQVFRSTKRYSGYGTKAYFTTKQGGLKAWYKNTKELKKGNRYYYKVRGVREIAGETVYTQYSNKAWRTIR